MKTLHELTDNPNFIPGIYNYCDRWCERCAFTSKCANFAIGEDRFGDMKDTDISNSEFWKQLTDLLKESMEMLAEKAREFDIDLNELNEDLRLNSFEEAKKHFLIQLCLQYEKLVNEWFEEPHYANEETSVYLETRKIELADAVEVIRWYQYQIDVKFRRALTNFSDNDLEFRRMETNGSAKVALIGIDRSLASWNFLLNLSKERQKSVIEIISLLNKIRLVAEKQFPAALSFIRPGLDE